MNTTKHNKQTTKTTIYDCNKTQPTYDRIYYLWLQQNTTQTDDQIYHLWLQQNTNKQTTTTIYECNKTQQTDDRI